MQKNGAKRGPVRQNRPASAKGPAKPAPQDAAKAPAQGSGVGSSGNFETLKENIRRIDKGNLFEALKRVKGMKGQEWKDPAKVRELTEGVAQDIGLRIDPKRMEAFMNAFSDATKNAGDKGPDVSVEDIAKRYGGSGVDEKTIKEIKKLVK